MGVLQNTQRERFAQLVASGKNGTEAYVIAYGLPEAKRASAMRCATRLSSNVQVQERIRELKTAIAAEVIKLGVMDKQQRLAILQEEVDAYRTIMKERAAHPDNQTAPGGRTGRMVKTEKMIGGGDAAIRVEEWAVDTATDKELREALKQAAIECGEWVEKRDLDPELRGGAVQVNVAVAVKQEMIDLGPEFSRDYTALVEAHARRNDSSPSAD